MHRFVLAFLIFLIIAFSIWCVWLLVQTDELQDEVNLYFGWVEDIDAVRHDLDRRLAAGPGGEVGGEVAVPLNVQALRDFRERSVALARRSDDPDLHAAVQKLRLALAPLLDEGAASAEDLWRASVAALRAAESLEARLRGRISRLHRRLGRHWSSLYGLAFASLALAASNLGLLILAHKRRQELEAAHTETLRHATHDTLTGLWNRDGILRLLRHELVRAVRSQTPLGLVLADLDNFREINVLLGQAQGDAVLEQVGRRLQSLVRPYDTIGRYGGDSFLVVLPSCDATATERVVDRLRQAIESRDVEHAFGHLQVTVSLAHVHVDRPSETDLDTMLRKLQERLSVAKKKR